MAIWRRSVEATHHFLSADDIDAIERELIPTYFPAVAITVAEGAHGVVGFSGVADGRLEMLFVDAAARAGGVGSTLLHAAIEAHPDLELDVNEQNPAALAFYRRHGFEVIGRSATDQDGRPFPLLHLARRPAEAPAITVVVVMGVAGAGKSTIGTALAAALEWDFQEGDELHPAANIAKMAAGHPLDDVDREPWLARIATWIADHRENHTRAVITCSALKASYRRRLAAEGVAFVHLAADPATLDARLARRSGHFFAPALLDSQLATLEPLGADEVGITVAAEGSVEQVVAEIIGGLGLARGPRPAQS
ncbi:MAG: gluconokinase, GntK/IdnK-type [Propionibacteriales bacterium]|nr:gluconokinase, GntK/IdnK-type [Propionibacteriales bacterium]